MTSSAPAHDSALAHALILRRIAKAERVSGRAPGSVHLTAVSKTQPFEAIAPVLAAGQRVFGENRVQEAKERWTPLRPTYPDLELRLIGPLQSNKTLEAMAFFDVIETLDRPKLAHALAEGAQKLGRCPRLYVQVNTGEEPQKAGIAPQDLPAFLQEVRGLGLLVEGLMCIPPVADAAGPHFALLRKLARRHGLEKLSMGMSDDYETAIRFGATSVRVGSAIFGARH